MHLAIAIAGAAGALARHGVSIAAGALGTGGLPLATLAVNLTGSWALGVLIGLLPRTTVTPAVRAGLTVGFCGGFTTFSTFAYETVALVHLQRPWLAAGYVAASVLLGVFAMFAGLAAGSLLSRHRTFTRRTGQPAGEDAGRAPLRSTALGEGGDDR